MAEYREAIESLEAALRLQPHSMEAHRNLSRAYLFSDKPELALQRLEDIQRHQPASVAVDYLTGVALVRLSRFAEAIAKLERAIRADPATAAIRYQLAMAYDAMDRREEAVRQLQETIRLDPQHTAAHYRLGTHFRNLGEAEKSRHHLLEYTRLRNLYGAPSDQPIAFEACIYTKAEPPDVNTGAVTEVRPPIDVRFTDATNEVLDATTARSAAALAIIDMDENGRYTFLVADRWRELSLLTLSAGGTYVRKSLALQLPDLGELRDCVVGNFYDEPAEASHDSDSPVGLFADVLIIGERGACLLLRTGTEEYRDVTQAAGLGGVSGCAARWVDYEYDGDLDLIVAGKTGLRLWQNNGNGTLGDVTAEVGMPNSLDCVDVEAADLDMNGAVDFIAAQGEGSPAVFQNQREEDWPRCANRWDRGPTPNRS